MANHTNLVNFQQWARANPADYMLYDLGIKVWSKQRQACELIANNPRVAIASSNAAGKSFLCACLIPWYLRSRCGGYVLTTGASWRSVEKILWPQLRRLVGRARNEELKSLGKIINTEWKISDMWGAFAVSPDKPENMGGYRTEHGCMVIADEASILNYDMMEAITGLCSAEDSRIVLVGNPLRPSGPFYDAFKSSEWATMRISAFETPNYQHNRNVIPGLATPEWVESRRRDWGVGSPAWEARVCGRFPTDGDRTVITLLDCEMAVERMIANPTPPSGPDAPRITIGVDVARFGDDSSVIQAIQGDYAYDPVVVHGLDTMQLVGEVVSAIYRLKPSRVSVDVIGIGAGVVDRLNELGYSSVVDGINVAEKAYDEQRYGNLRAEAWHDMRDWLKTARIPNNRGLTGALTSPRYQYNSKGQIMLEPKEETKKRLQRSPDEGDALMLARIGNAGHSRVDVW